MLVIVASCPLSKLKGAFLSLQNEHKEVKVDEILGREEAEKAIKEAMVRMHYPACFPEPLRCTRWEDLRVGHHAMHFSMHKQLRDTRARRTLHGGGHAMQHSPEACSNSLCVGGGCCSVIALCSALLLRLGLACAALCAQHTTV